MPELPEVETVRALLVERCVGRRILAARTSGASLRQPMPNGLSAALVGKEFVAIKRHGKVLMASLSGDNCLLIHLGMTGRFLFAESDGAESDPHDHLTLALDDGSVVRFNDCRRFGEILFFGSGDVEGRHHYLARLGPDALSTAFSAAYLLERLRGRRIAVKAALLDQRVVAGIGNIYACESLFWAGIAPGRPARSICREEAAEIVEAVQSVLKRSIELGGATLDDYRGTSGELGSFDQEFAVFGRTGRSCPRCSCEVGVIEAHLAGRITYFCRLHQR